MYWAVASYGRKEVAVMAIRGVDIALGDLIGKVGGEPVYRCLDGATKPRVQAYANGDVEEDRARGFRALKVSKAVALADGREGMERNVDREAAGEEAELMLDC